MNRYTLLSSKDTRFQIFRIRNKGIITNYWNCHLILNQFVIYNDDMVLNTLRPIANGRWRLNPHNVRLVVGSHIRIWNPPSILIKLSIEQNLRGTMIRSLSNVTTTRSTQIGQHRSSIYQIFIIVYFDCCDGIDLFDMEAIVFVLLSTVKVVYWRVNDVWPVINRSRGFVPWAKVSWILYHQRKN